MIYNDNDRRACAWLSSLIEAGEMPSGNVIEGPIQELQGKDIAHASQLHLFAGIGGWPLALRLAGWPDDRPVWTGSCPCQPFSAAGRRRGTDDERHLWPHMLRLVAECRPPAVFGEQVASADGREWLAGVRADLEALGYAVGSADLCAAGVGAPHPRQRLYWVGHTTCGRWPRVCRCGQERTAKPGGDAAWSMFETVTFPNGQRRRVEPGSFPLAHGVPGRVGLLRGYGNAIVPQVAAAFVRAFMESTHA